MRCCVSSKILVTCVANLVASSSRLSFSPFASGRVVALWDYLVSRGSKWRVSPVTNRDDQSKEDDGEGANYNLNASVAVRTSPIKRHLNTASALPSTRCGMAAFALRLLRSHAREARLCFAGRPESAARSLSARCHRKVESSSAMLLLECGRTGYPTSRLCPTSVVVSALP